MGKNQDFLQIRLVYTHNLIPYGREAQPVRQKALQGRVLVYFCLLLFGWFWGQRLEAALLFALGYP